MAVLSRLACQQPYCHDLAYVLSQLRPHTLHPTIMCGIAGILHQDHNRRVDRDTLRRMTRALSHRGPDGEGYYEDGNIGLGHRRLAIIDLATGSQPMYSRDRDVVVVFNGEIYNYVELREELIQLGHEFVTTSDTEVIIAAYKQWGFDCQQKFNGMWALALWDVTQRQLLLSRDRMGEKPLHYSVKDGTLTFGSEIKSLLAFSSDYKPATELLHIYLSLGYVPAPYTLYSGISRLLPGHYLVVRDGVVEDRTYWDLPLITETDMRKDSERIYKEFEEYFLDSVKLRMRSDVPFGAFLSGGLDSASVVAGMSAQSSLPVETFTIGFAQRGFDERHLAREVAKHFGTNHHENMAAPEMFDEALEKVLLHFDEPFGDASAIPVGLVSGVARQHVTMALTGDGGDEVLSGYTSYVTEKITERYRAVPRALRSAVYLSTTLSARIAHGKMRYRLNSGERFLNLAERSFDQRAIAKMSTLGPESIRKLIPDGVRQLDFAEYFSQKLATCPFSDAFYKQMYFHLKVSLPDDMLAKVDRMSMSHSLETRLPFLDHRLVELTYQVHKDVKMPGLRRKDILRRTIGRRLPPSLLKAPKMPFSVPLRDWFKQDDFHARLRALERQDFGLNSAIIRDIVDANRSGQKDYGDFIWRLFVLKQWMDAPARPLVMSPVAGSSSLGEPRDRKP
jgi:asparagine synthase (glutamine-hydrolysing)